MTTTTTLLLLPFSGRFSRWKRRISGRKGTGDAVTGGETADVVQL